MPRAAAPAAAPAAVPPPKRVRTGTAVIEDLPGEGDGCDRCFGAACDEERCCPSFWLDDGTPPIWPLSWIFGRSNPYLNDNDYVEVLGNCGYKSADRERKALMGTALGFTVFSIVLTVFGCLALSPNPSLTRAAAWAVGHLRSADTGEGTVAYVGLSKLVIVRCADAPAGLDWHEWGACEQASYPWSEVRGLCEIAASRERQAVERAEALEEAGRTGVDYSLLNGRELNFQLGSAAAVRAQRGPAWCRAHTRNVLCCHARACVPVPLPACALPVLRCLSVRTAATRARRCWPAHSKRRPIRRVH